VLKVNIRKAYNDFILEVDFSMNREILSILGPSGSGKTMTLKCIAGLIKPDEGHIELNGKILYDSASGINLPSQQRKVGFVFQNYALFPHQTVNQNIAFAMCNCKGSQKDERVARLLERMHVKGLGNRYPRQLSSGQQQRVALARALSHEPEILLLDEPFSALDTPRRERLEYELLELQSSYQGDMLFVTHDLSQGYRLSSRLAIYESGRIIQCDSKRDVISCPVNRTVARLTGLKNLMEGQIQSAGTGEIKVNIPRLNKSLSVARAPVKDRPPEKRITVGIRPEHILVSDSAGANAVAGKVMHIIEGVTTVNIFFHAGENESAQYELEASLPRNSASSIIVGGQYYFHLPPEYLVIIED
jgi:molybdate transport system ATP-binding protein